jgi:hypothetical protein
MDILDSMSLEIRCVRCGWPLDIEGTGDHVCKIETPGVTNLAWEPGEFDDDAG